MRRRAARSSPPSWRSRPWRSARGSCTWTSAASIPPCCPRPTSRGSAVGQRRAAVAELQGHRRGGAARAGLALAAGFAAGGGDPLLPHAAPRGVPAAGRLAGGADRGDRARRWCSGWGFGIVPEARGDRADLLLPGASSRRVDGLARVDPDQLKLLRTLDASRWQAFRFAELPAALPARSAAPGSRSRSA